jgi:hypothetical protein
MTKLPSPPRLFRSSRSWCIPLLSALFLTMAAQAQKSPDVPIISGGIGMFSSTNEGFTFFQPVVAPVLALPLGTHLLIESRADLRGLYQQNNNTGPFHGSFTATLEYLQADLIVNPHVTITAGRFLTPFGTYNERLTPIWIRNLQDSPLIFPIGTRTSGSSNGIMIRGNLYGTSKLQVDNTAFFSTNVASGEFQSARAVGDRVELYFPQQQVEIGASAERFLQSTPAEKPHRNSAGVHVWWTPTRSPLQIRSEYAHGPHTEGYWIESGYRLSQFGGQDSLIGRFMPVFRMQQLFRLSPQPGDGLPSANTQQADFGFDYFFPHEVRLNTSYARTFSTTNGNIWDISLTHRFLFPVWKGGR